MVDSFNQFDPLFQFCDSILEEIIAFMDTKNSKPTRHQAANCLVEISQELLRLWTAEGLIFFLQNFYRIITCNFIIIVIFTEWHIQIH